MSDIDPKDPASLIGRTILIGITYMDADGEVARQVQLFGTITRLEQGTLIIERDGRQVVAIPADVEAIQLAEKGIYRLRESGEEIENPDLLSTWSVYPPEES